MSDRVLVATRKGLFEFHRNGRAQWAIARRSFLGVPVSLTLHDAVDGTIYAALDDGHFGAKLHRSEDGGASWQEIAAPSYAGIGGNDAPSLQLVWSMAATSDGTLWAGTIPGGLFRSTDRGVSWALVRSLWDDPRRAQWFGGGADEPGIHSICVDSRDPARISIGVSCGGVWQSDDNGESWHISCQGMWADYMPPEEKDNPAIQDPHRLVQCRDAPDTFWVQHHNGIFRSTDGAQNWTMIDADPSSFGFAVAVHPARPQRAWFVPGVTAEKRYPVDGRFVVTRTDDGGKSFATLTEGLPTEESYDLVYRHGLDIDASGERLVTGSTTGNLWLSENGGDSWRQLSGHLPPIYAVCFA
jgi:hypothetical protein